MASDAGLTGETGASTAQIANIGTLGTALNINTGTPGDNGANMMLVMAAALDEQTVPEENRWFVAPPLFYKHLFSAGGKFAEVQVTAMQLLHCGTALYHLAILPDLLATSQLLSCQTVALTK